MGHWLRTCLGVGSHRQMVLRMAESHLVMLCSVFPQARQTSKQTPVPVMHLSFSPQLGHLPTPKLLIVSAHGGMGKRVWHSGEWSAVAGDV